MRHPKYKPALSFEALISLIARRSLTEKRGPDYSAYNYPNAPVPPNQWLYEIILILYHLDKPIQTKHLHALVATFQAKFPHRIIRLSVDKLFRMGYLRRFNPTRLPHKPLKGPHCTNNDEGKTYYYLSNKGKAAAILYIENFYRLLNNIETVLENMTLPIYKPPPHNTPQHPYPPDEPVETYIQQLDHLIREQFNNRWDERRKKEYQEEE